MNAIAYIRVSTSEQAGSGLGLESQRARVTGMAAVKDWTLIDVIEDAGASGKDSNRDGLREVMAQVNAGLVSAVIVAKLDRLTRSVADLGAMVDLFAKRGVALVSTGESIDTSTAMGRAMVNMIGVFAQLERESIGERTRDALAVKRERGERAGTVPFGYRDAGDGSLIEDDGEQQQLATMREMRARGETFAAIADSLNAAGVRTRRGGALTRQGISQVLKRSRD